MPVFDALVSGLFTGGIYALAALGLGLIRTTLGFANLAHGSLLMAAMYLAWLLAAKLGIDPYAALPLLTLVMFAAGAVLYAGVIRPFGRGEATRAAFASLVVAGVLELAAVLLFGPAPRAAGSAAGTFMLTGPPGMVLAQPIGFAAAAGAAAVLWVFLSRTDTGRSIRAAAAEPLAARLVGIRPGRMATLGYAVGTACLGPAACLLLPTTPVGPATGFLLLLASFAAVAVGGLHSAGGVVAGGVVAGGLVVGVAERLGAVVQPEAGGPIAIALVYLAAPQLHRLGVRVRGVRA